jgi:hypothetical protein
MKPFLLDLRCRVVPHCGEMVILSTIFHPELFTLYLYPVSYEPTFTRIMLVKVSKIVLYVEQSGREFSVFLAQFFYKPKTALYKIY